MLFEERLLEYVKWYMKEDVTAGEFDPGEARQSNWDDFLQMVECFFARQRRGIGGYYTNGEGPVNTRLIKLDILKHEVEESIKRQKTIYKDNNGNR